MDIGIVSAAQTLESRYTDLDAPVLLTGTQALVRLLLEQARLDRAAGLRTAGLVSGYRGSPLGGVDQELWRRAKLTAAPTRSAAPTISGRASTAACSQSPATTTAPIAASSRTRLTRFSRR